MSPFLHPLLRGLVALGIVVRGLAAEPVLRPHDVIAFVGGEDMVAMSEYGYLELLLVRARPDYQLRFRNLAWEGDTVFEQRRDLNFPPLEVQLDKIGATVVIAQFGQMESLAGKEKLPEFIAAYEKLIERMSGGGKRRMVFVSPTPFEQTDDDARNGRVALYRDEIASLARRSRVRWIDVSRAFTGRNASLLRIAEEQRNAPNFPNLPPEVAQRMRDQMAAKMESLAVTYREGVHLSENGHETFARIVSYTLDPISINAASTSDLANKISLKKEPLRSLITAKNRLWFHYWRPQNWAFLNGDRINQPSSRDHLDPSKRWFPAEIEEFIPLIEGKEREIDALATQLSKP